MISVEQAEKIIHDHWRNWGTESCSVSQPFSRILAESVLGDRPYPPFHRVMMDGIALSFESYLSGQRKFKIESICPAGRPLHQLQSQDHAIEVMTGAGLPLGCDLVIPYEHIELRAGYAIINLDVSRTRFEHTHAQGSDYSKDQILLHDGKKLNGPRWGIAASVGAEYLKVKRNPKVMIISTGDELVDVGKTPLDHQIRRSNAHALQASLLSRGFTDITLNHIQDDYETLLKHFAEVSPQVDILIYSGGVSKGKYDYLPKVWEQQGIKKLFHEVSQKPGKPMWFGQDEKNQTLVAGLPGNPVSSLICLHRYLIQDRPRFAQLTQSISFSKPLTYFVPVKIEYSRSGITLAHPLEVRNSGEYVGLAESDGFIELPKEGDEYSAGQSYRLFLWSFE